MRFLFFILLKKIQLIYYLAQMFLPLFCFLQCNVCKNVNNTLGIKINMCCTKRYNTYNSTTCGSSITVVLIFKKIAILEILLTKMAFKGFVEWSKILKLSFLKFLSELCWCHSIGTCISSRIRILYKKNLFWPLALVIDSWPWINVLVDVKHHGK